MESVRAATALLPPHAPRACPGRGLFLHKSGRPDLCWGRAGEGGSGCSRVVSANCYPHPQPLPSRLRACPLPAAMNLTNPGKPGLVEGGERTECLGEDTAARRHRHHSPRHPCEMTGNLGIQPGTHPPRPGLRRIDDTQKPRLNEAEKATMTSN